MRSALPKVLQPLAGQPMLRHVIECAHALGAEDICIVYGHGGETVPAAFPGEALRWVLQAEQLGTGHAAQQAMPGTPDANRVLILFGDVPLIRPSTLASMITTCGPDEVAVLTVDMDDPHGYERIVREHGNVVRNVEQKDASEAEQAIREINTGVLCAPAVRLKGWLSRLGNANAQGEYYLTDVIGMAASEGVVVHGVKAADWKEVMGINDRKQLAEAERALQLRLVEELMTQGVSFADPARVDIRGQLECGRDVFIDVNAVFEGDVTLGDNVKIESGNVVRNSSLGAGTVVHPNCHIEGATTGAACEIGPFARLRPGAELANNVKVGTGADNDLIIKNFKEGPKGASFQLVWRGTVWGKVEWHVPGLFNARNAAVAALAASLGAEPADNLVYMQNDNYLLPMFVGASSLATGTQFSSVRG